MSRRLKVIVIVIVVLGGVIMGSMLFKKKDIVQQIENDLEMSLGGLVSVVEQQHERQFGENHINAKFIIEKDKVEAVREELEKKFGEGNAVTRKDLIPRFQNTCDWWDLDLDKKVTYYEKMEAGKRAKTIEIWAFISEDDDQHFLYIAY